MQPNLFSVHLAIITLATHTTYDAMHHLVRVTNGLKNRRPSKKIKYCERVNNQAKCSTLRCRFLHQTSVLARPISNCIGAHSDDLQPPIKLSTTTAASSSMSSSNAFTADASNCCEVCLSGSALVLFILLSIVAICI